MTRYTLRTFRPADEAASLAVTNGEALALRGEPDFTPAQWRAFLETPRLDPHLNIAVAAALDADGRETGLLLGVSDIDCEYLESDHTAEAWGDCAVDPLVLGHGIGTALLGWGDARALALAAETGVAASARVRMRRATMPENTAAVALLEAHGYARVRLFYRMALDLTTWPVPDVLPAFPPNLALRPFRFEEDGHALYQAQQEIWRDHWGFAPETYDYFRQMVYQRPEADARLWRVLWDVDTGEIAAFAANRAYSDEARDEGWIAMVGTRRPYRRQGLASALLVHSFAAFRAAGFRRAMLGVDAASPTNALALYARVGMQPYQTRAVYEKTLRPHAQPTATQEAE
jgi:GNAT superfamily N-acetyltransferase